MMASNEETPEAKAFREHYATLAKAIQNPDTLANELFTKGILSREVLEELQTCSLSTPKKNGRIVQCVYNYLVFIDPSKLQVFSDILRQESYSSQLSEKLIASYGELMFHGLLFASYGVPLSVCLTNLICWYLGG